MYLRYALEKTTSSEKGKKEGKKKILDIPGLYHSFVGNGACEKNGLSVSRASPGFFFPSFFPFSLLVVYSSAFCKIPFLAPLYLSVIRIRRLTDSRGQPWKPWCMGGCPPGELDPYFCISYAGRRKTCGTNNHWPSHYLL